jgi:hypothetical protein
VIAPKKEIIIDQNGKREETTAPWICVDFRDLNWITKKNAFLIPRIDDLLDLIAEQPKYFSSFDLYSGYHQIPLTPEASEKSVFVTPDGHFQYLQMPFGLCNALATFQSAMTDIFDDMIGKNIMVYIDDIQLYSQIWNEHVDGIKEIFKRLREKGFYLKGKKCTIGAKEMKYLGFIISRDELQVDQSKIQDIKTYPELTNLTEVRAFLGLASFYRKFVKDFSTIVRLLHHLMKKGIPFDFGEEQKDAMKKLQHALSLTPILM